ncbi:MAG TPA: hypothetical protein VLJ37_05395 [bacterium]|nr:hypothetical protein [bacterium]
MRISSVLLLAIALSCAGFSIRAGELTPQQLQLMDQMRGLMKSFQQLEVELAPKTPRYDEVIRILDEMAARAETVKSLKDRGHPSRDMKRLSSDIVDFKREAARKSSSGVEDGMNRLSENCFRCHLSHSSPEAATKNSSL